MKVACLYHQRPIYLSTGMSTAAAVAAGEAHATEQGVAAAGTAVGVTVLCYFMHRKLDFRHAEVEALAELVGCPKLGQPGAVEWGRPHGGDWVSPFWYLTLPSLDTAVAIARRSVLVKVRLPKPAP